MPAFFLSQNLGLSPFFVIILPMNNIDQLFSRLAKSKFRSRFKLTPKGLAYFRRRGMNQILAQATNFITQRLAPANPPNEGRQTPMKNHPVFIAQHATATCCRQCLQKWHNIPKNKPLTEDQITYITRVIEHWLRNQPITEDKSLFD